MWGEPLVFLSAQKKVMIVDDEVAHDGLMFSFEF
jgi:hypothetical protein